METLQPLDQIAKHEENYELATSSQRLGNLFIDTVIVLVLNVIRGLFFRSNDVFTEIMFNLAMSFAYYFIMETATGKTIGKYATQTIVVRKEDIGKISPMQALGRSICRWIPFEPFSFLGSPPVGWHDSLTNTFVVKDRSLRNLL